MRTDAAKRVLLKEVFAMAAVSGVQVHSAPSTGGKGEVDSNDTHDRWREVRDFRSFGSFRG